jgi:hypothetical protein
VNPILIALISLRTLANIALAGGRSAEAAAVNGIADAIESGRATDAHLAMIADKLKVRQLTAEDWADVRSRIDADAARLHAG